MIERIEYLNKLDEWWEQNNNDALFVLGPIGIGKTTLIQKWAESKNIPHNFIDEDKYSCIKEIFLEAKNKSFDISLAIVNKLLMNTPLNKLLIFDGISPNDEIIVQLKNLCANSKHRFILISDYGEYVFDKIRFVPVGSIRKIIVKPLSFKEYCLLKTNHYPIDSVCLYMDREKQTKLPFSDMFEEMWDEYSNFGGFPCVVEKVLESGIINAELELKKIKKRLLAFIDEKIQFSSGPSAVLNNFSNRRSSSYRRFVFSKVSDNGTLQRYKRTLSVLERIGIIGILPFEGEKMHFEYCDLYLCDPGLERIWGKKADRMHIVESIVFNYGLRKGYKPYRFVLADKRIIDLAWDYKAPTIIEIKLKNTNLLSSAIDKLNCYLEPNDGIAYNSMVLVDKGVNYFNTVSFTKILPIWAYLLRE